MKASTAESSPFLTHGDLLKPWYERAPWDAVWSSDPGKVMVKSDSVRTIFVAPVNTQYLNMKRDAKGVEVQSYKLSSKDADGMATFLRQSFIDAIKNETNDNLEVVEQPTDAMLLLEIALVELVPTKVWENTVADVGGLVLPGSKAIEEAAVVGAQAAGGAMAAGTIAMEFRISDRATGNSLAEAKDRESDPASVLPNYKDFEEFGWSRNTVKEWSKQFAEVFTTTGNIKVNSQSNVSFLPW